MRDAVENNSCQSDQTLSRPQTSSLKANGHGDIAKRTAKIIRGLESPAPRTVGSSISKQGTGPYKVLRRRDSSDTSRDSNEVQLSFSSLTLRRPEFDIDVRPSSNFYACH